jgi:BirA family biotin operon repressor/biotin-[acetyl-CoA-carboxylase] ligase
MDLHTSAQYRREADRSDDSSVGWGCQPLWERMNPLWPGLAVEVVGRLRSTNGELVDRLRQAARNARGRDARADDLQPTLLVAVQQTQGRGRMGRAWQAQANLSLTFSLAVPLARPDWSGLSLAVGVAVAKALDPAGRQLQIKWPNDLWLPDGSGSGRKLGGVLIETMAVGDRRVAVIGVGLNVRPMEPANSVASVSEFLPNATPPSVLADVAPVLAQAMRDFDAQGFGAFSADFAARDLLARQPITTTDATCPDGEAQGVDGDGALKVLRAGVVHRIISGEVSVRPAPQAPRPD